MKKIQTLLLAVMALGVCALVIMQVDQRLQVRAALQKATESAQLNTIANNLRILEGAKEQYALENKLAGATPVEEADLLPYLKGGLPIQSVVGETYTYATVNDFIVANWAGTLAGKTGPFTVASFPRWAEAQREVDEVIGPLSREAAKETAQLNRIANNLLKAFEVVGPSPPPTPARPAPKTLLRWLPRPRTSPTNAPPAPSAP